MDDGFVTGRRQLTDQLLQCTNGCGREVLSCQRYTYFNAIYAEKTKHILEGIIKQTANSSPVVCIGYWWTVAQELGLSS